MAADDTPLIVIDYWYGGDIPRKTLLAWSLLLMWQNDNGKPLRRDLELHASVPAGTFDKYIEEFCDQRIMDNPESCRLQVENGCFQRVLEHVQNDIGVLDELPFDGFRFRPNNKKSMQKVWVEGGCQLLVETWAKVPGIRHEFKDWKVTNLHEAGRTICFSTGTDAPEVMFYFSPTIHATDKSEFVSLIHAQSNVLHEQVAGKRKGKGVIALAAALSFGTGTFEGDIKLVMLGPITLMMIVHFFRKHPEHVEKLYNALLRYLDPFTGQRNEIIRGAALITKLQQVVGDLE
jgi:hypothetical protein